MGLIKYGVDHMRWDEEKVCQGAKGGVRTACDCECGKIRRSGALSHQLGDIDGV